MQDYSSLQTSLLRWYRKNKRDLPWRRTKDPYRIWVSEVMLQQTTVEAVIPYYERFLKRFPNVGTLARSAEEEVLSLWSGLGYYSRARNLHRAVKGLACGLFPKSAAEWQKLPGIGRYTAGAIASIVFGERAPVLDGNVIRVLSRLFRISADPKSSRGQKIFWRKAGEILPAASCGDFNQALMELGATVCLPESPLCRRCPIRHFCMARKKGEMESFPRGRKKAIYRDVTLSAAVVKKGARVLMVRRPGNGLLGGMWEIPMGEGDIGQLTSRWPVEPVRSFPAVRHTLLNRRLRIQPFLCRLKDRVSPSIPHRWILPSEISRLPSSSMNRKILEASL